MSEQGRTPNRNCSTGARVRRTFENVCPVKFGLFSLDPTSRHPFTGPHVRPLSVRHSRGRCLTLDRWPFKKLGLRRQQPSCPQLSNRRHTVSHSTRPPGG